ncbi:hypothetical protein BOX15_Mlig004685g2 [Macrostomum lignano]|uniref:Peptidase M28 domain-containing protein n=2 Tax=Macrostomum lignano TaxID=282301 RepID=A0A267GHV1_9PLAT|nr:hypothetical protein BOX15_Mlig004685g2 [Macrostomum lignano]
MSTSADSFPTQLQRQPPAHRQVSYEAAEMVEDDATLVSRPGRHRNGGSIGGGGGSSGGVSGGVYSVAGVALCAFVLGCLISFAVTLLATRVHPGSPASDAGRSFWPDGGQLAANRARLRRLANSPEELEGHVTILASRQSRAGSPDAGFHADYVAGQWRGQGLPVLNRTYSVALSFLSTGEVPQNQVGVFLCRQAAQNSSSAELCDEKLRLDPPLTPEDGVVGALPSIVPYTESLNGSYRLATEDQLAQLVAWTSDDNLRQQLADIVVLVDVGLEAGASSASSTAVNSSVLGMTAGLLKKLAPEPRPGVAIYPDGPGVPDTLIWMKSTLATAIKGDPTTPMYPSKAFAVRSEFDPPPPSQPAIPISAADARQLRDFAKSSAAGSPSQLRRLRIRWPMRRGLLPIRDICTEVKGAVEPDRVVLLGGHRDAWHSGALDPHSGVSSLLVITRALAELQRTGWRPRRTLLACSWDAEEWNLIGSAEWLDEELRRADRRLVAYVNTDTDIMGNWKVMVHAFRRWRGFLDKLIDEVPNPDPNGDSRYHFYKTPDAYSDYYVFWRTLGVPIVDLSYIRPNETRMVVYDLYHSRYDTARLYRMIDPGGRAHLATVQNYLGIVYTLLDSAVLPGNLTEFSQEIEYAMGRLVGQARVSLWTRTQDQPAGWATMEAEFRRQMRRARRALRRFESETLEPLRRLWLDGGPVQEDPARALLRLRMANDKLMEVQQAFVYRSVYPSQSIANLLADEPAFANLFAASFPSNSAEEADRRRQLMKLVETSILSLASVTKIMSDSFAD